MQPQPPSMSGTFYPRPSFSEDGLYVAASFTGSVGNNSDTSVFQRANFSMPATRLRNLRAGYPAYQNCVMPQKYVSPYLMVACNGLVANSWTRTLSGSQFDFFGNYNCRPNLNETATALGFALTGNASLLFYSCGGLPDSVGRVNVRPFNYGPSWQYGPPNAVVAPTWGVVAPLPGTTNDFGRFGSVMTVTPDGEWFFAAAPLEPVDSVTGRQGAVYVFRRNATGGYEQVSRFEVNPSPDPNSIVSMAVTADGATVVVGAASKGAVLFTRAPETPPGSNRFPFSQSTTLKRDVTASGGPCATKLVNVAMTNDGSEIFVAGTNPAGEGRIARWTRVGGVLLSGAAPRQILANDDDDVLPTAGSFVSVAVSGDGRALGAGLSTEPFVRLFLSTC